MVLNLDNLHNQVRALLEVVSGGAIESVDSPLATIAGAVLKREVDISSDDMPLSAFNVRLSQEHGTDGIPVISFPALGERTDARNAITSAIYDYIGG